MSDIIISAMEVFEIKRKIFEVIEKLGERSYKVSRNGKIFFLKDFENDKKGFENYVESEWKLNGTGINHPKIYAYDKNILVVASEFIEGETVLDNLVKGDLDEQYFELVFRANWFVKKNKMAINYEPHLWKLVSGKLFYLGQICGKFEENSSFEKESMRLWFYTKDFAKYLLRMGLPVDKNRVPSNEATVNKKMALTVVKYYV